MNIHKWYAEEVAEYAKTIEKNNGKKIEFVNVIEFMVDVFEKSTPQNDEQYYSKRDIILELIFYTTRPKVKDRSESVISVGIMVEIGSVLHKRLLNIEQRIMEEFISEAKEDRD